MLGIETESPSETTKVLLTSISLNLWSCWYWQEQQSALLQRLPPNHLMRGEQGAIFEQHRKLRPREMELFVHSLAAVQCQKPLKTHLALFIFYRIIVNGSPQIVWSSELAPPMSTNPTNGMHILREPKLTATSQYLSMPHSEIKVKIFLPKMTALAVQKTRLGLGGARRKPQEVFSNSNSKAENLWALIHNTQVQKLW